VDGAEKPRGCRRRRHSGARPLAERRESRSRRDRASSSPGGEAPCAETWIAEQQAARFGKIEIDFSLELPPPSVAKQETKTGRQEPHFPDSM
jgi:hypothetical protein